MKPVPTSVSLQLAGTVITFECGRIARQAGGAVLATTGDNAVLATVVAADAPKPGTDFFPLTVEYREKMSASGRIPGSFGRREGRIADREVLVSRLIDRTVRSLFPEDYRCEVQIQVTVFSADPQSDLASLALLAACAALHVSPVPAAGPAAGLRVARHRDAFVPFPTTRQRDEAELDFVVSAGPSGLVMVEGEAREQPETTCLEAIAAAQAWIARLHKTLDELRAGAGKPKLATPTAAPLPELPEGVRTALRAALALVPKAERRAALAAAKAEHLAAAGSEAAAGAEHAFEEQKWREVRERILAHGQRLDGRGLADIRPIWCEVGWLQRPHGSAIFTRGETQALVTCTLGTDEDAQSVDGLAGLERERFLLHYNFPPYSVNEIRPLRGPGRREIGHGELARRGLRRMLPGFAEFPYVIRIEAEISESNGSSSMATVCGGTLAMLHAGVPLTAPVAGIAMGLVKDGDRVAVLSDILGDEDHLGDMDFKVVGTATGVTALQLDNKVGGLAAEMLAQALDQARAGRLHILAEMQRTLAAASQDLSQHAPRVLRTAILPEAIGALVGVRGANIKGIQAETKARVTVDDHGIVLVYAARAPAAEAALRAVRRCAGVIKAGGYYRGVVTGVKDFGAFVRLNPLYEGLVPASDLAEAPSEGAELIVRVLGADDRGRLKLTACEPASVDPALIEF